MLQSFCKSIYSKGDCVDPKEDHLAGASDTIYFPSSDGVDEAKDRGIFVILKRQSQKAFSFPEKTIEKSL